MGRPSLAINSGNCIKGCERRAHCRGMCSRCYRNWHYDNHERARRGATKKKLEIGDTLPSSQGYVLVKVGKGRQYRLLSHVVMEQHIGRRLDPKETVHHKNGDRLNNKISNLELWSSRHPKGQRVEDLLEFAHDIIGRYGE